MIDLSIVIPAYNASRFIIKCLDSIFTDYKGDNIEVIIVNDYSTDNTLRIVQKYASFEKRIKIVSNKKNEKLSKTRQIGMAEANGLYIMHLDADDWLLKGSVKFILSYIHQYNPDILVYNYYRENEKGNKIYPNKRVNKLQLTNNKKEIINFFLGAVVTKVVKRELLRNLEISKYRITNSEDFIYSLEILFKSESVLLIPEYFYVYFQNQNSITNNLKIYNFIENQFFVIKAINNLMNDYNVDRSIKKTIKQYFYNYMAIAILSDKTAKYKNIFKTLKLSNRYAFFNNSELFIMNLSLRYRIIAFFNVMRFGEFKKAIFLTIKNK